MSENKGIQTPIESLPADIQAYIKRLREEARRYRDLWEAQKDKNRPKRR